MSRRTEVQRLPGLNLRLDLVRPCFALDLGVEGWPYIANPKP